MTRQDKDDIRQMLRSIVRTAARSHLARTQGRADVELREVSQGEDLTYDHWIAVILVSTAGLRLQFRSHFTSRAARELASTGMGLPKEQVAPATAHDFVREYCNLTAGSIKKTLLAASRSADGSRVDISCPVQRPAFDDAKLEIDVDSWALKVGPYEVICVASAEISDPASLAYLMDADLASLLVSDAGEVQFL